MKNISKIHFPEIHMNPISRDLVVVVSLAMLVALAIVTAGMMVFSQM